jgi:hypothetical protein
MRGMGRLITAVLALTLACGLAADQPSLCEASARRCNDNKLEQCSEDGAAWEVEQVCASADVCRLEGCDEVIPGQEGRIDGSVWEDGAFNDPAAKREFCATHQEAWFCAE